jgi:hypothetical protein
MTRPTPMRAPGRGRLDSRTAGGPHPGRIPEGPRPPWPPAAPTTPTRPKPGPQPGFARVFIEALGDPAKRKALARMMADAARPPGGRS